MCNACGFYCCGWDGFEGCGCEGCPEPDCWLDDEDDDDFDDDDPRLWESRADCLCAPRLTYRPSSAPGPQP